ncbi:Sm-like ribonucleo protein [Xylona heveae TC161]|uniref:U6 snRNA-associated Sm-like protein LSm1 n=1 Tax=Xylona heveae (strain CBS 132557 / TC161) TaxID=1328760 RepID=A0A165A6L7_XYLHT|nr:Sm-like ribonucleo protein [Xylona heveae TC161]KZF20025.1 Sm-like ribonucleo protein [Xylona heveae TC161]
MEHLSLRDTPPPPAAGTPGTPGPQGGQPSGVAQLPPQMFTTAAQLLDLTDKKLMVSLRDGRKLIGVLRSWDQFANLVLQDTVERIFADKYYADVPRGIYIVRGENVLLLGEIDLDKDDYIPEPFQEAPVAQVFALQKKEQEKRQKSHKFRKAKLAELGFEGEHAGEVLF